MTARAFFDKGIYKSTLKRFALGSVLYFIMLFLSTSMMVLMAYEPWEPWDMRRYYYVIEELIYPSMALALIVPTVVALLLFRFVHSKKTSIFVHSLPVTKTANYISTLAGAFTLMAVPVVLNGIILSCLSAFGGYGYLFSPSNILVWTLFNLLALFIMFSVSTFAAMCTGNSFALVVINAILIFAPLLIASITETILLEFLYGYSYTRNLLHFADSINPMLFIGEVADNIISAISDGVAVRENLDFVSMAGFIIMAIALYVGAWFIYKLRRAETSEDVAGFKVLNPIFKYFVTFVGTISVFALFTMLLPEKTLLFTFLVVLGSVVFYFGSEMLLKKTVKVWRSYKGYLAFGCVFTAFILFLGLTSVFGYETYVPEMEDVEEAALYNYYHQSEKPFTDNEELKAYIIETHKNLVDKENRPILIHDDYVYTRLHIEYKLKNGKTVTRRYEVGHAENEAIMEEVYNIPGYKEVCEAVFDSNIKEVTSITIGTYVVYEKPEVLAELLECIKKDVLSLSYEELYYGDGANGYIEYIPVDIEKGRERVILVDNVENLEYYDSLSLNISKYYTNTLNWLDNNGYGHIRAGLLGKLYGDYETVKLENVTDVRFTYRSGNYTIERIVEDEADIEALKDIFNGYYDPSKADESSFYVFDEDFSVTFNNNEIWFCPEINGYKAFLLKDTGMYFSITEKEMAEFKAIAEKYGMALPTV